MKTFRSIIPEFLLASRPALFILIVLGSIVVNSVYRLRTESIFACQAGGYSSDRYLAYCQAAGFGDYEHGALWYDLEPSVKKFAATAEVLFLGDSRLQFAFSTAATADWFASTSTPYYLLGFTYRENHTFTEEILRELKPQAKVYILNVDPFFETSETPPARAIRQNPGMRMRYEEKRRWQLVHGPICNTVPLLCGNEYSLFRSRASGAYDLRGNRIDSHPVSYDHVTNHETIQQSVATGGPLLSRLPVKSECIILTVIPTIGTNIGTVKSIADALESDLIAPELDGLQTFDDSHLDSASAERWSKAFLQAAAPRIRKCLGKATDDDTASADPKLPLNASAKHR
jgi:hypothetical protein